MDRLKQNEALRKQLLLEFADHEVEIERKDKENLENNSHENLENNSYAGLVFIAYIWIQGFQKNSNLIYVNSEEQIYSSNGYNKTYDAIRFRCYCNDKSRNCDAKIFLKKDGRVFKKSDSTHKHGSMYNTYVEMKCYAKMKEMCLSSPASTTPREIYNHCIADWHKSNRCIGPFPRTFETVEKTLRDSQRERYGPTPNTIEEIVKAFEKPAILEGLGRSHYGKKEKFYNGVQIGKDFSNCIFSSPQSIALIKKYIDVSQRFFLMDATFRITPNGIFNQVLVIYVRFGLKVNSDQNFRKKNRMIHIKLIISNFHIHRLIRSYGF